MIGRSSNRHAGIGTRVATSHTPHAFPRATNTHTITVTEAERIWLRLSTPKPRQPRPAPTIRRFSWEG